MPRISEFIYKDKRRVAIEKGPDSRGNGCLFCFQLVPEKGYRSFKPGKMMDCKRVGLLRSLWYLAKSMGVG